MDLKYFGFLRAGDKVHVYQNCSLQEIVIGGVFMIEYASPLIKFGKNRIALHEDVYLLPRDARELLDYMESDLQLLKMEIGNVRNIMAEYEWHRYQDRPFTKATITGD